MEYKWQSKATNQIPFAMFCFFDDLSDLDQGPPTYTYELIQTYHFEFHISDASTTKEKWDNERRKSSEPNTFSFSQNVFYPLKDKDPSFQ